MKLRNLILYALLLVIILPSTALAEPNLTVRPGLNGLYKVQMPVQLQVTIDNDGPAIEKGLLVVKQPPKPQTREQAQVIYSKQISVPAQGIIETSILVPGELVSQAQVYLMVDGVEVAIGKVQGVAVKDGFIGIGSKTLTGGLPQWLEDNLGNSFTWKNLAPEDIPTELLITNSIDLIVVDPEMVSRLSSAQREVIHQWVKLGGVLMLSGGAGTGAGEAFADISPVITTGWSVSNTTWDTMRGSSTAIPVTTGTLVHGEALVEENNNPLMARSKVGRGWVFYVATGLENFTAQDYQIWKNLLNKDGQFIAAVHDNEIKNNTNINGQLLNNSADIENLGIPSLRFITSVWGVYLLLVAPGLYILLRRYKRQDWAWLCIPVIALLFTVGIYYSSSFHKFPGPVGQVLATIEIIDGNLAEVRAGGSFVAVKGEALQINDSSNTLLNVNINSQYTKHKSPILNFGEQQQVEFAKTGYPTLHQISAYKVQQNFGQISGELQIIENKLTGNIHNKTNVDLERCLAIIGNKAVELPSLPAGGKVDVEIDLVNAQPYNGERDLADWFGKKDSVTYPYTTHQYATQEYVTPTDINLFNEQGIGIKVVGYAGDVPGLMQLNNPGAENRNVVLVTQHLSLKGEKGSKYYVPAGYIPAQVVSNFDVIEHTPEGYLVNGDQVTIEFDLTPVMGNQQFSLEKAQLIHKNASQYQMELFDWTNSQWVTLSPQENSLEGEKLLTSISKEHRLRLKIKPVGGKGALLPELAVEGVLK